MRETNFTQALTSSREISARATITDILMRFYVVQASESITIASTDSELVGANLLRIAIQATTNQLFYAYHTSSASGFASTTWIDTTRTAYAGSRAGLYGSRLFYQAASGTIYYTDYSSGWSADVSTGITNSAPVSIAPVSATEFYVVQLDTDGVHDYQMRRIFYHTTAGTTSEYFGRLYGDQSTKNIVDSVRLNGIDYIYLLDNTDKRTVYIKRHGALWSEVKQVVPMDIVDDITSFIMSSATVINNIVVVTGVLSRSYGSPMHVYMVGPEEFTVGKEMFIRPELTSNEGGKLHLFDGKTWYVGSGIRFQAEQTAYLGVSNPNLNVQKTDIHDFQLQGNQSSGYTGGLHLFHDFEHTAMKAGSTVKLEACVNGEYSALGLFNIDGYSRPLEEPGATLELAFRSDSFKRLSRWTSDTPYDYWSQTKLKTNPKDYTDVVRVKGNFQNSGEYLYLDDFNTDGFMYVTSRASTNGTMRARFQRRLTPKYFGTNNGFQLGNFDQWTQEQDNGFFAIGNNSGDYYATFVAEDYLGSTAALVSNAMTVVGSQEYQFSFFANFIVNEITTPGATVRWYNSSNVLISEQSIFPFAPIGANVIEFTRYATTLYSPPTATSCRVAASCTNGYNLEGRPYRLQVDDFAMTELPPEGVEQVRFGVGINYYLESKYDASVRLGIDQGDVKDEQCGGNGIFAIYESNEAEEGIGLYYLENNVWSDRLAYYPVAIDREVNYWLQIGFTDGRINVHYRRETDPQWTLALSQVFSSYTSLPWKNSDRGRGAIYTRNVTPYSRSFSFSSTSRRVPVEDASTFNEKDIVIIDSEIMLFNNRKQITAIPDLQWMPGKLLTSYSPNASIDYARYSPMGVNSYQSAISQTLSLDAAKHYLTAIDVRLAKCVNDELCSAGGLSCGIYQGTTEYVGTQVGNLATVLSANIPYVDDVSETSEGMDIEAGLYIFPPLQDKVRFKFDKAIGVLNGYKFVISPEPNIYKDYAYNPAVDGYLEDQIWVHAKNRTSAAPNNIVNGYAGRTRWYDWTNRVWDATAVWPNAQWAWGLEFDVYESAYKSSNAVIHVAHSDALSHTAGFYKNYNIAVTSGLGEGQAFKIIGYKHSTAGCAFLVDQDPVLDKTSVLSIVPALLKTVRGLNGTAIVAHGGSYCHSYRNLPFLKFDQVHFFSSEQDLSLEDMVRTIARKAGVMTVIGQSEYPATINPTGSNAVLDKKNFVIKMTLPALSGTVKVSGRRVNPSGVGIDTVFSSTAVAYYYGETLRETFPLETPLIGEVTVSYWDNFISTWCEGRFIHAFVITDDDYAAGGNYLALTGTHNGNIAVHIPQASIRIDNFILDEGKKGDSLIADVIGEKRFLLQDGINGELKIFRDRTTINTAETPYVLSISGDHVISDASIVTRMRLEGSDVKEKIDTDMMVEYGNVYYLANMNEINSPADADFFTDVLLQEVGSRVISKAYIGAADPRVEPDDIIYLQTAAGTNRIVVATIGLTYTASKEGVGFDMTLTGYLPRADVL